MFESANLPCYIERMGHKTIKIGSEKYKGTELVLRVDPFTPELASELADTKGVIFKRTDGTPNANTSWRVTARHVPPLHVERLADCFGSPTATPD